DQSIVIAAAITQPLAARGKRHSRHEHEINRRERHLGTHLRAWLAYAPDARRELSFEIAHRVQPERARRALHSRQHELLAAREHVGYERAAIEFGSKSDVRRYAPRGAIGGECEEAASDASAEILACGGSQRIARRQDAFPQLALLGARCQCD